MLYVFQMQIEQKFKKSTMNKNFIFPRVTVERRDQDIARGSLDAQASGLTRPQGKQLMSMAHSKAFSTENVQ